MNGETLFVRSVGLGDADGNDGSASSGGASVPTASDEVARVVRAHTPTGGRPEPVRVARLAARGAQTWHAADADRHG